MDKTILVINSGSSSLKYSLFDAQTQQVLLEGLAERLNSEDATLKWCLQENVNHHPLGEGGHSEALTLILALLKQHHLLDNLLGIGHRVVHGGEYFSGSVVVNSDVIEKVHACARLAPLHNPANILGIELLLDALPAIPQVAVFDTAFHQTMPEEAYLYPLPYNLYEQHRIRRYGFHGTSHHYVSEKAIAHLGLPANNNALITAHLGNGCSATAIKNGQSWDTSMGFTPLEGLMMGTRSGDIDPGIPLFLATDLQLSPQQISDILNKKSGLLGVSELSNDMRTLVSAAENGHEKAALALDIFCYRLAKTIAALAVALGRIDGLVFTGGIGENAAIVRSKTLARLKLLGLQEDILHNSQHGKNNQGVISTVASIPVLVIATQEELMIAKDTLALVSAL